MYVMLKKYKFCTEDNVPVGGPNQRREDLLAAFNDKWGKEKKLGKNCILNGSIRK